MGDLHTQPKPTLNLELVKVTKPRPELAIVELNDPSRSNAMDEEMAQVFGLRVEELKADPNLKAVLLLGTLSLLFGFSTLSLHFLISPLPPLHLL